MTTIKQVQNHISRLIAQDKRDSEQVKNYYEQSMYIIKSSMRAFFNEYAQDHQLTLLDVSNQVNSWDLQQFESAINQFTASIQPNSDLNKRLLAARATAQVDKRNVLASIVTAGIAVATYKTQLYGNKSSIQSYIDEYNYRSQNGHVDTSSIPKDVAKQSDYNSRVWVHGDLSAMRVKQTINKSIQRGMSDEDLNHMTKDNHGKQVSNNLDSSAQAGISFNQRLLISNSINNANDARSDVYKSDDTTYLKWVTEDDDKVCDDCAPLDGNIYTVEDAPTPQFDTHINCRCTLERCDKDGNLI